MFFILPIGSDISVRRLPKITLAIIIINLLVFLFLTLPGNARLNTRGNQLNREMHDILMRYFMEECRQGNYEYNNPGFRVFSEDFQEGKIIDPESEDYLTYIALRDELDSLLNSHVTFKYGYIPEKPKLSSIIGHMFLHGGFLHIIGNMWFLWLVGINLEDRWGRWYYLAFYLMSGVFSVILYGIFTVNKGIPLIGASGAVAGLMGAFMVRFYNSKMKFFWFLWLFIRPFWGTFEITAWFAMGLWFLHQILQHVFMSAASNVAFLAHIFGFIFGLVIALGLKFSGIENKFIKESVLKEKAKDVHNPLVAEAQDSLEKGNYTEAMEKIEGAIKMNPENIPARLKAIEIYEGYVRDKKKSYYHFLKLLEISVKKNDPVNFMLQFENYNAYFPDLVLPEKIQYFLAYSYNISG
ncbi:MAG TPA: rhomboid family intramembrane serine protease, partial [Firmicutes bacterium]|nr:rhomboid family intramembrane serine protease [Bacillota bacterium]